MSFVHLHVHTEYSLLDGFSKIPHLMQRTKEMGMDSIAITDHGAMYGVIDFFKEAQAQDVKPLIGIEAYLAPRRMGQTHPELDRRASHLLLLAENKTGYQNLLKIASAAQLQGFYYNPRIDHEFLAAHSEGLIATSGCLSAEIPRAIANENLADAQKKMDWYYDVFGPDNFFIELQHHDIEELHKVNLSLKDLGQRYEGRFVATNDVHYVNQSDARLQDILLCVQTGSLYSDPRRMRMSGESFYLRSPEEMGRLFAEVPTALSNTVLIAERCDVDLSTQGYTLPDFEVPEGHTTASFLRELCVEGLRRRYGDHADDPEISGRLEKELSVIDEMGFNAYFLIVWDLCRYAAEQDIWYNARGSAAGSIVAYALDITLVDPIEHGLIFERFLNPARVNMPDIDLDFQDDQRHLMMEYCTRRYGEDKVAAIITFGKLKARAAVRDVGRVLDVPLNEVDRVAKLIPNIPGKPVTISEALEQVPDFAREYKSKAYVRELIDTAREIEGSIRNAGTHAAGVVITDDPVIEHVPLHRPTGSSAEDTPIKVLTQFEMSTVDDLGLLKVDFLGLSTLTIMARACELIRQRRGKDYSLQNIPIDDPDTFELLGKGETAGVFQFEGTGMRRWMMQMKPSSLDHAVAMVALFRPGPMDFIPDYISRMHGQQEVSYAHPDLEAIFSETYGIPVYQEQLMFAVMEIAGYEPSEADDLRKAIAKKIEAKLRKHRRKFVEGAVRHGLAEKDAEEIFIGWENFARYGFNKAHAADYATIAVQTAYLKAHYAIEYMTALLSVAKSDSDKVAFYIADCRRMGIEVLPPDINRSDWDFTIDDSGDENASILFGLGAIKNVGQGPVDAILQGRADGPFENLEDLARRVDMRQVGKRALESLTKAGALDAYGGRHQLLAVAEQIVSLSSTHFQAEEMGQMTFFEGSSGMQPEISLPDLQLHEEYARREMLNWERDLIGLFVSDHPLSSMEAELAEVITHFSGELALLEPKARVRVAGLVTGIRNFQTKRGQAMAFATIEDTQGTMDLVIFPKLWERVAEKLEFDKVVIVEGRLDERDSENKILVDSVETELDIVVPLEKESAPDLSVEDAAEEVPSSTREQRIPNARQIADTPDQDYVVDDEEDETPEPPEVFPEDWMVVSDRGPLFDQPAEAPPEKQSGAPIPVDVESQPQPALAAESDDAESKAEEAGDDSVDETDQEQAAPKPASSQSFIEAAVNFVNSQPGAAARDKAAPFLPTPQEPQAAADGPPKLITITLRSEGDRAVDILRMRRIYGTLISYPGSDRFAFYVIESGRGYQLEFPNDTTHFQDDLRKRLEELVGEKNLRVETITYQ